MISIPQEIHFLSLLTNFKCSEFRHLIVTANKTDPLGLPDAKPKERVSCEESAVREAHLFVEENSEPHKEFDRVAAQLGITRKVDCVPEPGMPPNICYTVRRELSEDFEVLASGLNLEMKWGVIPLTPKVLFSFNTPDNFTWIVTRISIRTLPSEVVAGDFRSDDFDFTGFTNSWFTVNGTPIMGVDQVVTFGLFNRPLLLPFAAKKVVNLVVQRSPDSLPAEDFQFHMAINSYLAPKKALDALASNQTQIVQPPEVP